MSEFHETNRRYWDANARRWEELRDRDGLWQRCPEDPTVAFEGQALDTISSLTGELTDKDVCVIGSGDNYAAFALVALGAKVTSTDISEEQLAVAAGRAKSLDLDIEFVRADAARLDGVSDHSFDLVCFNQWVLCLGR